MNNLTDKQRFALISAVGAVAVTTMVSMCVTVCKLTKLLLK